MKRFLISFLYVSALFAQAGGQPVNIPIPLTSFVAGYGSSVVQDLHVTPAQLQEYRTGYAHEGVYTLNFSATNSLGNYPGYFKVTLSYGTQNLCEPTGWGKRASSAITFICASSGYLVVDQSLSCDQNPCITGPVQDDADLFLSVTVNGWPVNFEKASLTFTPD